MKLMIDAGHGGKDSGATFGKLKEKDVVIDICSHIYDAVKHIFDTRMTRVADYYVSLTERADIANEWGADYFLSIHTNADPDTDEAGMPEAKGEEIWYYRGSLESRVRAEIMKKYVDMIFEGESFRGLKATRRFYVLRKTKMPANLIELGFIDNSDSYRSFKNPAVRVEMAYCIVLGLLKVLHYTNNNTL